jgi:hypothetical protein
MGIRNRGYNRDRGGSHFMVLDLNGKNLMEDVSDNLTFSCTNKKVLARNTGVAYHKLVYWFSRLNKTVMIDGDNLIIRSRSHYKGKQPGGIRNLSFVKRGGQ